ncbi:von Willebrand factor-like [Ptychodera flava]|uniref:von Willebrand factor-like n=1 Tax=Ptychodera flava TaxID=63121 RepID=UPI003969F787
MHITGVITQGRSDAPEWVETYLLYFSLEYPDGNYALHMTEQMDIQVFQGNTDNYAESKTFFWSSVEARSVKVQPLSWHEQISMRVEFLGCPLGPVDYCAANDCQNGAECVSDQSAKRYECNCAPGYSGQYCQDVLCVLPQAPHNGSFSCETQNGDYVCSLQCLPGFELSDPVAESYTCNIDRNTWTPELPSVQCVKKTPPTVRTNLRTETPEVITTVGEADGHCLTWGQTHYRTFDGMVYDSRGSCSYLLAGDCVGNSFRIHVHNDRECTQNSAACQRWLTIYIGTVEINLKTEDGDFAVYREQAVLTVPNSIDTLHLEKISQYLFVRSTLGFSLKWDGMEFVSIQVDGQMTDSTCGLCGRYNEDPNDDLSDINGNLISEISTFANSYKREQLNDDCSDGTKESYCNIHEEIKDYAVAVCEDLNDGVFASCHSVLDHRPFFEACLEDVCNCNVTIGGCECFSMAAYARECVRYGVTDLEWRTPERCPVQCDAGMVYKECGDICPMTCKRTVYQCIDDRCVDGCQCPEDRLLHNGACLPATECPCQYGGREYSPGSEISADDTCNICICEGGAWNCTGNQCGATCWTTSNLHYRTFDGRHYDFAGDCAYVLLANCDGTINDFNIGVDNSHCNRQYTDSPSTCDRSVIISVGRTHVWLKKGQEVIVDGNDVAISALPYTAPGIFIEQVSEQYQQVSLDNGLVLLWDGNSKIYVHVTSSFFAHTCGLCGIFDNNQQNDFWTLERDIERMPSAFGRKWKLEGSCKDRSTELISNPCDVFAQRRLRASELCQKLREAPFTDCHNYIDVSDFHQSCMYDLCSTSGNAQRTFCDAAATYAMECANKGHVLLWRDAISECTITCSGDKVYQECGSACESSCGALAADRTCQERCIPGCSCPGGMVEDYYGDCIPIHDCPCLYNDRIYLPGATIQQGCKSCVCQRGKVDCPDIECDPIDCGENMEYVSCQDTCPQTCVNMHTPPSCASGPCEAGCQCLEGYVRDGDKCVPPEDCPCNHGGKSYAKGEEIKVDCNTCTCNGRKWECGSNLCHGLCTAWGESHHKTFDGKEFDFFGECVYVLSRSAESNPYLQFTITTENIACSHATEVTCAKAITFSVDTGNGRETIKLERYSSVTVPPGSQFEVWKAGLYVFVRSKEGVTIKWDKGTRVYIKLEPKHMGMVEGLCGNFNGNQLDDFRQPNGGPPAVTAVEFSESWKRHQYCGPTHNTDDTCFFSPHRRAWSERKCSVLKTDLFKPCHAEVPYQGFFERCVFDACACDMGGDCECLCTAIAAYAQECNLNGIHIRWRTQELCPMQCEGCGSYEACTPACPRTCDNFLHYEDVREQCEESCVEGCECPADEVYDPDTNNCISESLCYCIKLDGIKYYDGQLIQSCSDPCRTCYCYNHTLHWFGQPCTTAFPTTAAITSLYPTTLGATTRLITTAAPTTPTETTAELTSTSATTALFTTAQRTATPSIETTTEAATSAMVSAEQKTTKLLTSAPVETATGTTEVVTPSLAGTTPSIIATGKVTTEELTPEITSVSYTTERAAVSFTTQLPEGTAPVSTATVKPRPVTYTTELPLGTTPKTTPVVTFGKWFPQHQFQPKVQKFKH